MTIIVWDGIELAGDRKATHGGTPVVARKVHRVTHHRTVGLFGFSGSGSFCRAYLHHLITGEPWVEPRSEQAWSILAVQRNGMVWHRTNYCFGWERIGRRQWAIGSGADYALGAMAAGLCATSAVRIATRLDNGCGLGVDIVRFE